MSKTRFAVALVAIASAFAFPAASWAKAWPSQTVRIIVPFGPGGGSDIQARLLAKKFDKSLHEKFIVDDYPGAGGTIGANVAAHSAPNGYNVLLTTASLAVSVTLYKKEIHFNALKNLTPVCLVSSAPLMMVVNPKVPAKTVSQLIALAKKRGPKLDAGSDGRGTTNDLAVDQFDQMAHLKITDVPFKGGGPMLPALLSNEVNLAFGSILVVEPQVKAGKLRVIAITSAKRSSLFPNLPTVASVVPGFTAGNWWGMFLPSGGGAKEAAIVSKLNAATLQALKLPSVRTFLSAQGVTPEGSTPQAFGTLFRKQIASYAKIIKAAHVHIS